jgi:hypothetical protein
MTEEEYIWNAMLKDNHLTKDTLTDYLAELIFSGPTAKNKDVAKAILAEGSELKYETIVKRSKDNYL